MSGKSFARMAALTAMAALLAGAVSVSNAETTQDGERYTMSPVDGGFVRLDKKSGAMSLCKKDGDAWACKPMSDDQSDLRAEVDKLKAENADLKNEIRRMEEVFGLNGPKQDGKPGDGLPGPQAGKQLPPLKMPSEKDVDGAIDYLEGMIRKFRERFEDFGDKTDPDRPRPQTDKERSL